MAANIEGGGRHNSAKLSLTQQLCKLQILTRILKLLVDLIKINISRNVFCVLMFQSYQEMVMICYGRVSGGVGDEGGVLRSE